MFAKIYGSVVLVAAASALAFAALFAWENAGFAKREEWKPHPGQLGTMATFGRAGQTVPVIWTDAEGTHNAPTPIARTTTLSALESYAGRDMTVFVHPVVIGRPRACIEPLFDSCREEQVSWVLPITIGLMGLAIGIYGIRVLRS